MTRADNADLMLGERVERMAGLVPFAIILYFAIQAGMRLAISENLEIDEAEIAGHVTFSLGYGNSNPPLYDWIVVALWKLTGSWPVALAFAKNSLLASTYLLLFRSGYVLFGTRCGAALLSLSLLLMPQIVWQSQITLSHSSVAAATSAAVITALVLLLDQRTTARFVALGIAAGAALLSKYSTVLLMLALAGGIATVPEARARLLERRLSVSAAIAVALIAPHAVWAMLNIEASTARMTKLMANDHLWSRFDVPMLGLDGLLSLAAAFVVSAGLLAILWAGARLIARREPDMAAPTETGLLFGRVTGRALAIGVALSTVGVLVGDVHRVHSRYLMPFLMILPFWLALQFPLAFRPRAVGRALAGSLAVAVAMTLVWPQIALFGNHRFAYPYDTIALQVAAAAGANTAVLMKRSDYARNIVLRMPEAELFEPAMLAPVVAALWDGPADEGAALMGVAGPCYRLDGPVRQLAAPFHYFSGNEARLSLAVLRFDPQVAGQGADC